MNEADRNYYRQRAEQELRAVELAHDPAAAKVHKALAARYLTLADQEQSRLPTDAAPAALEQS